MSFITDNFEDFKKTIQGRKLQKQTKAHYKQIQKCMDRINEIVVIPQDHKIVCRTDGTMILVERFSDNKN